ncbi:MAG: CpcT/CpeT family chromophore lyase [Congregibacter sp.]
MRYLIVACLGLFCFGALSSAQDQPPLQRDLMIISELFPGTYDNMEQVYFDIRLDLPAEQRHRRVRSEVRRIPNSRFGDNAFFVMDYWYARDSWRPRIYAFDIDEAAESIRMKMYFFEGLDTMPYLNAHEDLSVLDALSPSDLAYLPACDVYWRSTIGGYQGSVKPKACAYDVRGEQVYADVQLMLSDRALWKSDIIRRFSDDGMMIPRAELPDKQLKARNFTCSMAFNGKRGKQETFEPLAINDQGGTHFVPRPTDEKPDRQIGIRLRNVDWAMNNTAAGFTNDVFVMYIVERASGQDDYNITYTWGAPEETSVGLNLQWLLASCYIVPQEQTRPYLTRPPTGPWQSPPPVAAAR